MNPKVVILVIIAVLVVLALLPGPTGTLHNRGETPIICCIDGERIVVEPGARCSVPEGTVIESVEPCDDNSCAGGGVEESPCVQVNQERDRTSGTLRFEVLERPDGRRLVTKVQGKASTAESTTRPRVGQEVDIVSGRIRIGDANVEGLEVQDTPKDGPRGAYNGKARVVASLEVEYKRGIVPW